MTPPSASTSPELSASCRIVRERAAVREAVATARTAGKSIGLVPTMGALHAGHLSLVQAARRECGYTIVTVFVNPTQFGPGEDFDRYPRNLDGDVAQLAALGVDLVFAPEPAEVYRPGHTTMVEVAGVAEPLEGKHRPGHFRGVATVVLKLFNMVAPDVAFFGQKDYQQSLVVRRLVEDLDVNVRIRVCPTVREPDGLALSSRNAFLSAEDRRKALALSRSLAVAVEMFESGERDAAAIRRRMMKVFEDTPGVTLDYLALADADTLVEVSEVNPHTVALVAARVGQVRLIDNSFLWQHPR